MQTAAWIALILYFCLYVLFNFHFPGRLQDNRCSTNTDWPRCRPYKSPFSLCVCACLNTHVLVTLPIISLHSWASFGFFFVFSRGPHLCGLHVAHPIYQTSSSSLSIAVSPTNGTKNTLLGYTRLISMVTRQRVTWYSVKTSKSLNLLTYSKFQIDFTLNTLIKCAINANDIIKYIFNIIINLLSYQEASLFL